MKACGKCLKSIDDHFATCPYCGTNTAAPSGGVKLSGLPAGVSWQPLTPSGAAASPAVARTATAPSTSAPPPGFSNPAPAFQTAQPPQAPQRAYSGPSQPSHGRGPARRDLQALIPRSSSGIIQQLEDARDQVYRWLEAYCRNKAIETSLTKSQPYSPSIWIECRAWNPEDPAKTQTDRWVLQVTVRGLPYHNYPVLYDVFTSIGEHSKKHTSVCQLTQSDIERTMDRLLTGDLHSIKNLSLVRIRDFPWQWWRAKNKISALDHPFISLTGLLAAVGWLMLIFVSVFPPLVIAAVGCWIAAYVIKWKQERRRWTFRNEGKPEQEPRILRQFDSWQALIFDLGRDVGVVRQEILAELRKGANSGFQITTETIWYWGLDGKEERDQLVARFRRGIAFIQVYAYGDDLFIGWDAHMNLGTWVEREVAKGFQGGRFVSLRTVEAGQQRYTEYDLFDTNCLVEWVHGAAVKVVKRHMAYQKIDQEIDFKIIRGDRKLDADTNENKTRQQPLRKLLHRTE